MISPDESARHGEPDVRPRGRRGRPAKPVPPAASGVVIGLPRKSNPNDWLHRHHDAPRPINWLFAAACPAIGRLVLDAIHDLSGVGRPIAFRSSAMSYQTLCKPFFVWLAETPADEAGVLAGADSTHIDPSLIKAFRTHLLGRVNSEKLEERIEEKTAYRYESTILRVLRHAWQADPQVFGPNWREEHFMAGEYSLKTQPHEPYSQPEAQRILKACTAAIRVGSTPDGDRQTCEAACFVVLGLKLGIEPECLGRLTFGDTRADGGGRLTVTYIKRRGGGGNGFRKKRTTNPTTGSSAGGTVDDAPEIETETLEATGNTFADAGGVLALLREAARSRATEAGRNVDEEPLFTIRMAPETFSIFSDRMHAGGLRGDDGERLAIKRSRLRPTWRVQRTIRHKGRISIDRSDNTPDVRAKHYLENERMAPFHRQAVIDAQDEALRHATGKGLSKPAPTVTVVPDDRAVDRLDSADASVAVSGEQDLWLASCRDFSNPPDGDPGKPCSRPFHGCLSCRNAIVTRRSLPFILSFQRHVERRRREMPTDEWETIYGQSWREITQNILPEFDAGAIAEAGLVAMGKDLLLHLPPELQA